jgi:hypothetical protein
VPLFDGFSTRKIYTDPDYSIMGMLFVPPNTLYYADFGSKIYRLDLKNLKKETVFDYSKTGVSGSLLSDLTDLSPTKVVVYPVF